jgi:SAM-dependent methyltransferase
MTSSGIERVELYPTRCAICGTLDAASELYPANFDFAAFNPEIFSARRLPDRIHYRIVRCDSCGLIRSDPVVGAETLAQLYAESAFTYDSEVENLKRTYGRYLREAGAQLEGPRRRLLEIGCGNGFFLEEALDQGFTEVRGVEPSEAAAAGASDRVRALIVRDMMRPGLFATGEFDVICIFQVFDHIPDPGRLLDECLNVLRPGGLIVSLNHNARSISARILGERSPIVDLEHTYLYSPDTMRRIVAAHGFDVVSVASVLNTYSLRYLMQLVPMPRGIKKRILASLGKTVLGDVTLSVPLGNLCLIGRKPVK